MIATANRKRIGLALSGGGFRATLFHLGMVRFLRDAGILPSVSHITSVSGGSVLAAHLVLNWDRYTGTPDQFDAVAAEVIKFTRLDVRNRIVRRWPLSMPIHLARWTMRMRRDRRLTRTGMLEMYYQHFLYGDTCMFQLPEHPQLHVLSTNLTEGSLCSFTRDGVIFQKRLPGELFRFERLHAGLATVPLAVTASSAFPGFFPPLQVDGDEVGATAGQFNRQVFTDGGVFDNLGVRMFRNIERTWIGRESRLTLGDMYDAECVVKALNSADNLQSNTPLARVRQMFQEVNGNRQSSGDEATTAVDTLSEVIASSALYREPSFEAVQPDDPEAAALLESARLSGKDLEHHDRVWLNRQLVEAVLRQVTGRRCLRPMTSMFDQVIVSDAGKHLQARTTSGGAGLIGTAMRASDIGMDRVWQLEKEAFGNQPGFLFASLTDVVEPHDDPTALHPEIQRRLPDIRTDLDGFSLLEISALVRHGYCVARSVCRGQPELFGRDLPAMPPWDPVDHGSPTPAPASGKRHRLTLMGNKRGPAAEVVSARMLKRSSARRVWSRLFDYTDWASYVYLLVLVPLLSILPLMLWHYWEARGEAKKMGRTVEAIANSGQDQRVVADLVRNRPLAPWEPLKYEEVAEFDPPNYEGITFTSNTLIFDLRQGMVVMPTKEKDTNITHTSYLRRRIRLHKDSDYVSKSPLRYQFTVPAHEADVRCLNAALDPVLRRQKSAPGADANTSRWELRLDLSRLPIGTPVDVQLEIFLKDRLPEDFATDPHLTAQVETETGMLSMWVLLAENQPYDSYRLLEIDAKSPGVASVISPSESFDRAGSTIIYWTLLEPNPERQYECHWVWQQAKAE